MSICDICHAPIPPQSSACVYDVPEAAAPWRADYAAIRRGDVMHDEHRIHVARWAMHNAAMHTPKALALLRELAESHAGQSLPLFTFD